MNLNISLEEFETIVDSTVEDLPEEFKSQIENVSFLVEEWPSEEDLQSTTAHSGSTLLGLYRGVPKTKRGDYYSAVLPDKIIIFAGPIISISKTEEEAKENIKKTVLHEIGHYFGMSEEEIRKAQK